MPELSTLAVVCVGFIAGFFFISFATRALRMLYVMLGKATGASQPFAPTKTLWALPLLLLQPGVWVLVAIPWLCYLAYSGRISARWAWTVVGFFLSIAYMSVVIFWAMRKAKRRRARAVGA
jgi:hypothetical protein